MAQGKKTTSRNNTLSVPSREAWGKLDDLDVNYAFNLYGGKSIAEVSEYFTRSPIERVDELRFAPWKVFSYYIFWFTAFLTSDESQEECDSASCFLGLLLEKARSKPRRFRELYPRLKPAVDIITGRQEFYDADTEIYGVFSDYKRDIEVEVASK